MERLNRIAQTVLNKDNNWTADVVHPMFLKNISSIDYYGSNRLLVEYYDNVGWRHVRGYHNTDRGYAFVITEKEDGTLSLQMPFLWPQRYDNAGFIAQQLDEKRDYTIKGNKDHSFTITNFKPGEINVEKTWDNIPEDKRPDSISVYLLLDGQRVVAGYDQSGNPEYRQLTLSEDNGWKGTFEELDPLALAAGRYSIEENSDEFAPQIKIQTKRDATYNIRIEYANGYREEGMDENTLLATQNHFLSEIYKNADGTYKDIVLNLYLDGKKIQEGAFTFREIPSPVGNGMVALKELETEFENVKVPTFGSPIRINFYDVVTNEPYVDEYNFHIRKDKNGVYTLYLPRMVIDGVPYADLFIVKEWESDKYGLRDQLSFIEPQSGTKPFEIELSNQEAPNHEIEIQKEWVGGEDKIPESIDVEIKDESNNTQKVTLTKEKGWKAVVNNLKGTFRTKNYKIKEVEIPDFDGKIATRKDVVKLTGKDSDGKEVSFDYTNSKLREALASDDYRYEVFEFPGETPDFTKDNLDSFIKVEKESNNRYIIRYAKNIQLTERLSVLLTNTYDPERTPPPEEPPVTPPDNTEEPPLTPPDNPGEPPVTPPGTPEEPPATPPNLPTTGMIGKDQFIILVVIGLLILFFVKNKKKDL